MNEGIISVFWSDKDAEYVATHSDFESLSYLDETAAKAVAGLVAILDGI